MKSLRLILPPILAALAVLVCFSVVLAAPVPPPRQFNGYIPPPRQITTCNFSYSFDFDSGQPALITVSNPYGLYAWQNNQFEAWGMPDEHCGSQLFFYLEPAGIYTFTGAITSSFYFESTGPAGSGGRIYSHIYSCGDWWMGGYAPYSNVKTHTLSSCPTKFLGIQVCESEDGAYWGLDDWTITGAGTCYQTPPAEQSAYDTCATVQDHHFTGAVTDTWLLSGSAAISNSTLTLPAGDAAGQNLDTLSSNTEYNAVVSVTNEVSETTALLVVLGVETDTMSITGPGIYTASLTTPNLGGPIAYILENQPAASATLEIDLTCLYSTAEEDERVCLVPDNGEFVGADDWYWYWGAAYQPLIENAYLPYNGEGNPVSLLVTSGVYSLPTLTAGENLLLSFESETQYNLAGVLGARVTNGVVSTTDFFEIYPYTYEFETDISAMAGITDVNLFFANTGEDPFTGFSATDNLYLDNVCIYVSEDEAGLPGPVDTDPVLSPGSIENWTCPTCSQIPAILYNYGLSVYYLEEMYNNGVSIWDYSGWVPWLAAALWVNAGSPLACWLLGLWCWWLGLFQYLIWEFLNWAWWLWRTLESFALWLALMLLWAQGSIDNIILWLRTNGQAWLLWAVQAALDTLAWLYNSLWALIQWIGQGFIWLADNIAGFDFLIQLWNLAVPLLQTIWSFLSGLSLLWLLLGLLLAFSNAVGGLLVMLITWAWANIFEGINLPIEFYQAFNQGIADSSFSYLLSCSDQNFWCSLLAGFQLVNESAGQNIMYPAVIVLIIVTTIWIFWNDIKALFSINIQ